MCANMASEVDRCPLCASERIPGFGSCANCGERWPARGMRIAFGVHEDPLPDHFTAPSIDTATCARALAEARALEYAGDVDGAIEIYERLGQTRTFVAVPYQRLAVLYRKRRAFADEERVVRLALAHIPSGPNSWFVVRLAKILGEKGKSGR